MDCPLIFSNIFLVLGASDEMVRGVGLSKKVAHFWRYDVVLHDAQLFFGVRDLYPPDPSPPTQRKSILVAGGAESWFWWFSLCWQARIGRVEVPHTEKKLRIVKNYIIPSKCATFFEGPTPLTISSKAPKTRKMLEKINGLSIKWGEPPEWWMENPKKISRQKLQAFSFPKNLTRVKSHDGARR